jgi:hypothetical protein
MKRVKENAPLIFRPLKEAKTLKIFVVVSLIMVAVYYLFGVLVFLLTLQPFPQDVLGTIAYGIGELVFTYTVSDIVVILLYALVGGLLYANYSYWKCASNKSANTGLMVGLVAATACPACALPLLGLASFAGFLTGIGGVILKFGVLTALVVAMYSVAIVQNKKGVCKIPI